MSISLFVECFVLDSRLVWFLSSKSQDDSYKAVAPRLTQSKSEVREEINLNSMKVNRDCVSWQLCRWVTPGSLRKCRSKIVLVAIFFSAFELSLRSFALSSSAFLAFSSLLLIGGQVFPSLPYPLRGQLLLSKAALFVVACPEERPHPSLLGRLLRSPNDRPYAIFSRFHVNLTP